VRKFLGKSDGGTIVGEMIVGQRSVVLQYYDGSTVQLAQLRNMRHQELDITHEQSLVCQHLH